ncbi:PREDICTED: fasciclin-like arabinogalactan protein 9 [Tarenaya hassleriana]|uniref:fasciclin-like arabinogalactan protein 9 n=1 Tax=Tarenaya hassleriana TaxID=28532 RepID=UPI00053C3FF9|nr:PREDICTED: fasciclin-like arabinogalactan protein 9 [Tarenaya hassleriana]
MASTPLFLLLIAAVLSPEISAQPAAPAPGPAGPVNLTAILEKGGQFSSFIHLLNTTQVGNQVNIQLNSSSDGMTVFAPTDNAFQNLKPGTLNHLSIEDQVRLILYHVTPKYYTLDDLLSVSNPVRTQASGRDGGVYGLNFTGQGNQVNVSTGVVETRINNALRQQMPLAVYVVDQVLLPDEMFGDNKNKTSPPAASAPKSSSTGDANATGEPKKTPKSSEKSGSGEMKNGRLGFALGLVVVCLKLFF